MNETTNPVIGKITCPCCGNPNATVHKNRKGSKLYIRCYPSDRDGCWTIQPQGQCGQKFIKEKMQPLSHQEQDAAADEASAAAKIKAEEAARETRRQKAKEAPPAEPENPKGLEQEKRPPKKRSALGNFLFNEESE